MLLDIFGLQAMRHRGYLKPREGRFKVVPFVVREL